MELERILFKIVFAIALLWSLFILSLVGYAVFNIFVYPTETVEGLGSLVNSFISVIDFSGDSL